MTVVDGIWAVHQDDPAKRSDGRSGLPIVRRSVATVGEGLPPDGGGDRRHNDDAETDRQTTTGSFPVGCRTVRKGASGRRDARTVVGVPE